MYIKIIGLIAASLTTFAFLPQAIKTWKTKSTDDLSPTMFLLLSLGVLLWLTYGILINDLPIILANGVTIMLASTILYYIFKPGKSRKIEHVALWTDNIEQLKEFYCKYFNAIAGGRYHNSKKEFNSYFLTFSSGARIELMQNKSIKSNNKNWGHISISVGSKSNVDKLTQQLKEEKINIISLPRTTGDGYYESVVEDPDGNHIEITV
jgi:lactoylglutathione lyase